MDIKRFDLVDCHNEGDHWSDMKQKQFGEYVRYRDIEAVISERDEALAKLAAMEETCKELRAYQDAAEDQLPLRYFVNEHLFITLQEAVTFSEAARSMHGGMYRVVPMYARPVPPAYKAIYRTGLPSGSSRAHLLNEAASRADYFFRQIDGSYSFPAPDGQVAQIIEMLLAAANKPDDKPAVAVPDDVKAAIDRLDTTAYRQWARENPKRGGYIAGNISTVHLVKVIEWVRNISAAPSHSQQSAKTFKSSSDNDRRCQSCNCSLSAHINQRYCPSHDSEQGGAV